MNGTTEREEPAAVGVSQLQAVVSCKDMVRKYLEANGYDGLYNDTCGCWLEDLMPCGGDFAMECEAGCKQPCDCDEGCDFHIGPKAANA